MTIRCDCDHRKGEHRDRMTEPGFDGRRSSNTSCKECGCGEFNAAPYCPHGCGQLRWADDNYWCPKCGDEWPEDVGQEMTDADA